MDFLFISFLKKNKEKEGRREGGKEGRREGGKEGGKEGILVRRTSNPENISLDIFKTPSPEKPAQGVLLEYGKGAEDIHQRSFPTSIALCFCYFAILRSR